MEIEVKLALDAATRARLVARLGAPDRVAEQTDVYLATAGVPVALRVRRDGDAACVTLKAGFEVIDGVKIREELEPSIRPEELDTWLAVFARLGFPRAEVVAKTRHEYMHGGVHLVLDEVQGLGAFVEVEVVGDDPTSAKAALEAALADLGLAALPRITRSYRDLLIEAGRV
ncbi:MAG: putative adenylate cyclase 2 [Cyanobacteria bacterium RYN_339]|nr:putative adenylate cyclase 2 [Cyanobacteria bacterium RYN_339]